MNFLYISFEIIGGIMRLCKRIPIVSLLFLLFITSPVNAIDEFPHHIAISDTPGELWIIYINPTTHYFDLYRSQDYGYHFSKVRAGGPDGFFSSLDYHRMNQRLTFVSDYRLMSLSSDGGVTIDEQWDWLDANVWNWAPDTTAWIAFNEHDKGYSFDSLRTHSSDVDDSLGAQTDVYLISFAFGWSPGDFLVLANTGSPDDQFAFAFSRDFGKHFEELPTRLPFGTFHFGGEFFSGASPGEAYILHGSSPFLYATRDTMKTWNLTDCTLIPEGELGATFWELIRGWAPGEIYWYCYRDYVEEVPLAVLYRSTDYGRTWQEVFKTRNYYISAVNESQPAFPANPLLTVWPNPTNGLVTVRWDVSGPFSYALYDLLGRNIINGSGSGSQSLSLNLNDFPSGVYFLRSESSERPVNHVIHSKIILAE